LLLENILSPTTRTLSPTSSGFIGKIFFARRERERERRESGGSSLLAICSMLVSCVIYSSTLKRDATCFSETSADFQRITRLYIPEDKLKSYSGPSAKSSDSLEHEILWNGFIYGRFCIKPGIPCKTWKRTPTLCRRVISENYTYIRQHDFIVTLYFN
jgi:hypothetical protein